jgi:branched-chain amino acid transport system substrate-binding protein
MKTSRAFGTAALLLVVAVALAMMAGAAWAQEKIVVGAGQPITGRFAFAGKHINDGLADYLALTNEKGGIAGKKIEYIFEDTGYDTNRAVASFKKLMAQFKPVVMYGESTGVGKAMAPEINNVYKVLYGSTSFSEELADRKANPYMIVSGPTYSQQFGILLKYIAANPKKKGVAPKVAFFYSDTEFGRDPIPFAREMAKKLGVEVVAEEVTQVGAVDVTSQILDLKRNQPDYCIFQGYVVPPIPDVIRGAKDYGLETTFMGTFWAVDKQLVEKLGPDAEGYMGVNPYAYWWETDVPEIQVMRDFNKRHHSEISERPNSYMQGWFTGMIFVKAMQMCAEKKLAITGENMKNMIPLIKDWDPNGLTGKVTFKDSNSTNVGRVYKADAKKGILVPASEWIYLD